jgi:uncharacterized membrane protein
MSCRQVTFANGTKSHGEIFMLTLTHQKRGAVTPINRLVLAFSRHWLLVVTIVLGVYAGLPWLAPVFMRIGWTGAGDAIYAIYSTQCHQLPQRSYFLFGPKTMYTLSEIQSAWQMTNNPVILRQFVGNETMGWKVAWSDRMVSMYTSIFAGGLLYWLVRKRLRPLPLWAFSLLVLPMAVDGGTHLLSDLLSRNRMGLGFRDSNAWLVGLTNNLFSAAFYSGDALGSFNSWMRLVSGLLFGLGIVGLVYPLMEDWMADTVREIEAKYKQADAD